MVPQASQPPQPLSLNDLLRQHCHDRLYVKPLHWTAQHLQLLKCRFVRRQRTLQPTSPTQGGPPSKSDSKVDKYPPEHDQDIRIQRAVYRLAYGDSMMIRQWGLETLLEAFSNDHTVTSLLDGLDFYYAGRPVARLPCPTFGRVIDDIPTPFLAYVDHTEVTRSRENSIKAPYGRIRKIILSRLQPTNIDLDPYFAGVLIALAQAQWYAHSGNTKALPSSYTVYLFVTNRNKTQGSLRLYTATVTAAFLHKFNQPSVFLNSSLVIYHTRIPLRHISHLKGDIAAMVETSEVSKKRLRESIITDYGACKRKKKQTGGSGLESVDEHNGGDLQQLCVHTTLENTGSINDLS